MYPSQNEVLFPYSINWWLCVTCSVLLQGSNWTSNIYRISGTKGLEQWHYFHPQWEGAGYFVNMLVNQSSTPPPQIPLNSERKQPLVRQQCVCANNGWLTHTAGTWSNHKHSALDRTTGSFSKISGIDLMINDCGNEETVTYFTRNAHNFYT
jgi:hypothetical protein